MNYPKFAVGEDVVIFTPYYPELNGKAAIVVGVYWTTDCFNPVTGKDVPDGYGYELSPHYVDDDYWDELELRKRPSDMSFDQLMESLKKPVNV